MNVTMAATLVVNATNVASVPKACKLKEDKFDKLLSLLKQMVVANATSKNIAPNDEQKSVATTRGGFYMGGGSNWLICSNCNKPGHGIANCWDKGGGQEGMRPDPATRRCQRCGKLDHFTLQCPLKQKT